MELTAPWYVVQLRPRGLCAQDAVCAHGPSQNACGPSGPPQGCRRESLRRERVARADEAAPRRVQGCLLYTSDAADDM
eukprot:5004206-Alexandrium_andersonii.AAC.1